MELFVTARQKLLRSYQAAGQPFVCNTLPYHSTRWLRFDVVDADVVNGTAFAVCRANQTLRFFTYGVGDAVLKRGVQLTANETDTNLAKPKSTNGAQDYVIEGIGFSAGGSNVRFPEPPPAVDPAVVDAYSGAGISFDPASLFAPPQKDSPFNLEQAMFQALLPYLSLEMEWDRGTVKKLGRVDILPQAGAASYLRANGAPESSNRYMIPEGFLWRRDGQPDSELVVSVNMTEPVVIPISLVTPAGAEAPLVPSAIWLDVTCRLFGLAVDLPSQN